VNENIYLSKNEQTIFNTLPHDGIEKTKDILKLFPKTRRNKINKISSGLSSKGYMKRLKKGVYLVQDKPTGKPVIDDPYKIAASIFEGYIGFSSALAIYGLLDYEPFTIFVVTKNRSAERWIGEYTFRSVAMGKRAVGMTYYKGVYVSTMAKTFFDCFYKPQYGGGYSAITKALDEADIDWGEFKQYLELGSDAFCQRTGYVLDMLNKETGKVPEDVLGYLRSRIKNNTKLVPTGRPTGKYNREWMVMDNLGKDNILSWWKHG
jgi:predicted transcriptional regulator of viral defense system